MHEQNLEKQLKKQIGCMTGFLNLFDRQHILTGKRVYSSKRLPRSPNDPYLESECSEASSSKASERESEDKSEDKSDDKSECSSDLFKKSPAKSTKIDDDARRSDRSSITDLKKLKEAPRLSLDSRATFDANGSLCARQIGSNASAKLDSDKQRRSPSVIARLMGLEHLPSANPSPPDVLLRRSVSESRISRDYIHFVDNNTFRSIQAQESKLRNSKVAEKHESNETIQISATSSRKFTANESFPGRKQNHDLDIDALKEIIESLQLKGLLHCKNKNSAENGSPIVLMKPLSTPASLSRRTSTDFSFSPHSLRSKPGARRHLKFQEESDRTRCRSSEKDKDKAPVNPRISQNFGSRSTRNPRRKADSQRKFSRNEDEPSSSDCSLGRKMMADMKEGKHLLERCDKLLHSIAEMTSPVSVLDSSLYKEEETELDDEVWSRSPSPLLQEISGDDDYVYVVEILQAKCFSFLPGDSISRSKKSKLRRKMVFDVVTEILHQKRQIPPWEVTSRRNVPSLLEIWSEFLKLRRVESSGELLVDEVNSWSDGAEMSELVLDIERQIFKDLVTDSVVNLASSHAARVRPFLPRRKLVF